MTDIQTVLQDILKELREIKARMPYFIPNEFLHSTKKNDCGCMPNKVCMNTYCPRQIRVTSTTHVD